MEYLFDLKVNMLPIWWRKWGGTKHHLLNDVDKEESSIMMKVKLDEMKLWLVIIT